MATPAKKYTGFPLPEPGEAKNNKKPDDIRLKHGHRRIMKNDSPYSCVSQGKPSGKSVSAELEELQKKTYKSNICAICQAGFRARSIRHILVLECAHSFHRRCVTDWVTECIERENPVTCPTCQQVQTSRKVNYILEIDESCDHLIFANGRPDNPSRSKSRHSMVPPLLSAFAGLAAFTAGALLFSNNSNCPHGKNSRTHACAKETTRR